MTGQETRIATAGSPEVREIAEAVCKKLLPEQEREDATQETLLRLWKHRDRYELTPGLVARLAQNVCRDWYRKRSQEQQDAQEWPDDDAHILEVTDTETPLELLLAVEAAELRMLGEQDDMAARGCSKAKARQRMRAKIGV